LSFRTGAVTNLSQLLASFACLVLLCSSYHDIYRLTE
jgi:hypothetical protein